jgi:hypothetical protein
LLKGGIGLGRSSLMDFPFMLESVLSLKNLDYRFPLSSLKAYSRPMGQFLKGLDDPRWLALISYCFVSDLGILPASDDREFKTQSLLDELQLGKLLSTSFIDYGLDTELSLHLAGIIRIIVRYRTWADRILNTTPLELLTDWLSDPDIHQFLGINRYQDVLWFNKESFEEFFWWITAAAILNIAGKKDVDSTSFLERSMNVFQAVQLFHYGQKRSGYQVNKLLIYLGNP